jgi:ribosomal protein S6--L-glutamate ligase
MKAAIISQGSKSSRWTFEAMKKYFDEVDHLDITKIEVNISDKPVILYNGEPIKNYDCIYAKGSFKYAITLRAITEVLRSYDKVLYMPFPGDAFTTGHDKILTHLRLMHNKIPTPLTYVAASPAAAKNILEGMNYPIIMKLPSGTQGKGVMFADSFASASSMLDTLTVLRQPFLIQEYIETGSTDLRAIVVGDNVIAAMKRTGKNDDKRANIHAGGVGEKAVISLEAKKIAVKAAKTIGAEICAVDILDSQMKGPIVIELNLSPGLQGITAATGLDVPDIIASYLAEKTKQMLDSNQKINSKEMMTDLDASTSNQHCIITNLKARGTRLILPEVAHNLSKIDDESEVELCLEKGKITIKKIS